MCKNLIMSVAVFCVLLAAPACSSPMRWESTPVNRTLDSPSYDAVFEPLKKDAAFFNWFRLTVVNKTGREMAIDWNRTRYLHNGQDSGLFVFSGIDPETIKSAAIPPDIVPAGGTFSKEITPFKLIAFTPLREQTIDTGRHNIIAGLIPAGENGIFLVISQDGKSARAKLTLAIENKAVE